MAYLFLSMQILVNSPMLPQVSEHEKFQGAKYD